jgi:hypothetical protein
MLRQGFARPWAHDEDDELALFRAVKALATQDSLKVVVMYEPYAASYAPVFEIAQRGGGAYSTKIIAEEMEATYVRHAEADWGETLQLARARNAARPVS